MPRLVAAPDKFRGTATAREASDAVAAAAVTRGWAADRCPMSDGGEGFLEALGGEPHTALVEGPLGERVLARWALRDDGSAVLEAAEAAGRARLPHPHGDDPMRASTRGVGQLLAATLDAGATSLVVGVGGVASTDGGLGCVEALDELGVTVTVPLVVACDVDARFLEAPSRFGPQKGAAPDQVRALEARLVDVAARWRARGVDVTAVPGAGAAGGLAGGLATLGATLVPGAALVADAVGLDARLDTADLVVTGEGGLDAGTLEGKVVAEVLARRPRLDALVVAGQAEPGVADALAAGRAGRVTVVVLDNDVQRADGTTAAIAAAVGAALDAARGRATQ